jgi:hypothetical protein
MTKYFEKESVVCVLLLRLKKKKINMWFHPLISPLLLIDRFHELYEGILCTAKVYPN